MIAGPNHDSKPEIPKSETEPDGIAVAFPVGPRCPDWGYYLYSSVSL